MDRMLWTGSPVCGERARLQDVGGRAASGTSRRGRPQPRWTGSPVCGERARLQDVGGRAASGTSGRGGRAASGTSRRGGRAASGTSGRGGRAASGTSRRGGRAASGTGRRGGPQPPRRGSAIRTHAGKRAQGMVANPPCRKINGWRHFRVIRFWGGASLCRKAP